MTRIEDFIEDMEDTGGPWKGLLHTTEGLTLPTYRDDLGRAWRCATAVPRWRRCIGALLTTSRRSWRAT